MNDPKFGEQFHHPMIRTEQAWSESTGVEDVVVAVTDDGFDLNHEDLKNSIMINDAEIPGNGIDDDQNGFIDDVKGWDFANNDNDPMSDTNNGAHGTHVAGIIAAGFDNGVGVTGMGPHVKVLPIKFYGGGKWTNEIVLKSYQYAVLRGVKIVNTSYNVDGLATDPVYLSAVDAVYNAGGIVFNSAGNSGAHQSARTKVERLALVASVQSGSNTSKQDQKSSFSNYGNGVDVAAPGNPILSLGRGNRYMDMSGTSMASPVAAGAMAYLWSVYPDLSRDEIYSMLIMGSDDINSLNPKYKDQLGSGRINLELSVKKNLKPLAIRSMNYDAKTKVLTIHLFGVIKISGRSLPTIGVNSGNKLISQLSPLNVPQLGTNEVRYSVNLPKGQYQLQVLENEWRDAFGRMLDGDRDGQPGGNWSSSLSL